MEKAGQLLPGFSHMRGSAIAQAGLSRSKQRVAQADRAQAAPGEGTAGFPAGVPANRQT